LVFAVCEDEEEEVGLAGFRMGEIPLSHWSTTMEMRGGRVPFRSPSASVKSEKRKEGVFVTGTSGQFERNRLITLPPRSFD